MLEPGAFVVYTDNLAKSSHFYQELFSKNPEEASETFHQFKFSSGVGIGLKDANHVQPETDIHGRNELAFFVENNNILDALFLSWKEKGIRFVQEPIQLPFGYTFVALDPDNNRLRIISLAKPE